MASSQSGAVATGADFDTATRRRNVPSTSANGELVDRLELDEKKTQIKQVRTRGNCEVVRSMLISVCLEGAIIYRVP
jgi:hypothetical protein